MTRPGLLSRLSVSARMVLLGSLLVIVSVGTWMAASRLVVLPRALGLLEATARELVSATAAASIDGDAHALLRAPDTRSSDGYARLTRQIEAVRRENQLEASAVRTLRLVPGASPEAPALELVIGPAAPGTPVSMPLEALPAVALALGGTAASVDLPDSVTGARLETRFTPIRTSSGSIDGLLELRFPPDYPARFQLPGRIFGLYRIVWILGTVCLLGCVLLTASIVRRTLRPLEALTAAIRALRGGQLEHRIEVAGTAPDLRLIGTTFNEMADAIALRQRTLEASERRYRTLFAASQDAIFLVDLEAGQMLDANPACGQLTGRSPGALLGASFESLWVPLEEDCPDEPEALPLNRDTTDSPSMLEAVRDRGSAHASSRALRRADGALRYVDVHAVRLELDGEAAALVTARDVTDRHEHWERMLQASKLAAIGMIASGVAHQLNNPLVGVLNFAQLLRRRLPVDDPNVELAETIEEGAGRCRDIVKALLGFARRGPAARTVVSVGQIVADTRALAEKQVQWGQGRLEVRVEPDLPPVRVNPTQLVQVVLNLVTNAVQAVGRGARVEIEASSKGGAVRIDVSDNGPGVPPEVRARIFEPFFTTKPPGEGTGLGLSVAEGIVREHGGSLELLERAGPGATFRLYLPAAGLEENGLQADNDREQT